MKLEVPYYSQREDGVVESYGYGACGLVSLRMVLSFYKKCLEFLKLDNLAQKEQAFDHEKGWVHSRLINIARTQGLHGFRINYTTLDGNDLQKAHQVLKQEGASIEELKMFTKNFHLAQKQGALEALDFILSKGVPVIVSMKRAFANTPTTHLLVVRGKEKDTYILNDPWYFGPNHKIKSAKFNRVWTQRAVVITPANYSDLM